MGMTTGLVAFCLTLLNAGWAANVQTVTVAAPTGITAVPPSLAAPFINSQINALAPQTRLTGVLQGPGSAPVVRTQLAPAASVLPTDLPVLPAPAAATLATDPQGAAPVQSPIISRAAPAAAMGRTAS